MILAGDLGGTKTVLALFAPTSGGLDLIREEVFRSRDFAGFDDLLAKFLSGGAGAVAAICLGVAGPVREGRSRTTNLPWLLDERELASATGVRTVRLLNDLEATAYGMLFLPDSEFAVLNPGTGAAPRGNIAVIAAGTGLGEAMLYWNGTRHEPVASEGGHADFAPRTDVEIDLLKFLRAEFGRVSYERVLSGPGLGNVYRFLRAARAMPEPAWLVDQFRTDDPGVVVSRVGLAGEDPVCVEALDLFASVYGAEAGNWALKCFAVGGVLVGGGIAPKIVAKLADGGFLRAFTDKGRYADPMAAISVKVALNARVSVIGAARYALDVLARPPGR